MPTPLPFDRVVCFANILSFVTADVLHAFARLRPINRTTQDCFDNYAHDFWTCAGKECVADGEMRNRRLFIHCLRYPTSRNIRDRPSNADSLLWSADARNDVNPVPMMILSSFIKFGGFFSHPEQQRWLVSVARPMHTAIAFAGEKGACAVASVLTDALCEHDDFHEMSRDHKKLARDLIFRDSRSAMGGQTVLMSAVRSSMLQLVKMIIDVEGVDVNQTGRVSGGLLWGGYKSDCISPLFYAAGRFGTHEIVKALVDAGADPRMPLPFTTVNNKTCIKTPLWAALFGHNVDSALLLCRKCSSDSGGGGDGGDGGVGLSSMAGGDFFELASRAAELGSLPLVSLVLLGRELAQDSEPASWPSEQEANSIIESRIGKTTDAGSPTLARLMPGDAAVDRRLAVGGWTILHGACRSYRVGCDKVAQFLLHCGANPSFNFNGTSMLVIAAVRGHVDTSKHLIAAGADPSLTVSRRGDSARDRVEQLMNRFRHEKDKFIFRDFWNTGNELADTELDRVDPEHLKMSLFDRYNVLQDLFIEHAHQPRKGN